MIQRTDHSEHITLEIHHGKANAIDTEFFHQLNKALDALEDDPRPLVLTGQGKMFSAGVDLFKIIDGGKSYLEEFLPALSQGLLRLFTWPAPVIAAINGHAIAGGCILAAACDFRLMRDDAGKIGVTELLVGVPFPVVALEVLRHLLPNHHVERLVKFGKTLDASTAQHIGLVDEVVPSDVLLERAHETARRLGGIPAGSFTLTKRHLRLPTVERIEHLAHLDQEVQFIWADDAILQGIRAFLEKTVGKK